MCAFTCVRVDDESDMDTFEVSIKNAKVASGAGQQFVNVKCAGNWTLGLTSEQGTVNWASLSAVSGTGNKSNVILSYQVNSSESSRTLKIILENGSKQVDCNMTQIGVGQRPEEDPDNGGNNGGSGNIDPAETHWMELPALDNPGLVYKFHSFKMGGKTYRNYSYGWSQKDRVSLWVAYPLSKDYEGSVNRNSAEVWALDPLLGSLSSDPRNIGNYGGPYDRGHQLPFADRKCTLEAAKQTFYGTNMTPQASGLNQHGWASFENTIRGWAGTADTLYVVTGCIVDPAKEYTTDAAGNKMTVPSAYYKAVLKYSKSSTLGQWNAAAFYYEHKAYTGSVTRDHAMSIDELEEITGIDFFVNLPTKIGEEQAAKLEAADPATSSVWW